MARSLRQFGAPASLAAAFAAFLGLALALTGRTDAPALVFCWLLGAFGVAAIAAGRPVVSVRGISREDRLTAAAGGLLAFFAPPAIFAAARLTDAPAGSVVVFWSAGGWTLLLALAAAAIAWRSGSRRAALVVGAGGAVALAGAAAIVANWERPSSFSPLIGFPANETAIFFAGAFLVAGTLLLVSVMRTASARGVLVIAAAAGLAAAALWLLVSDPANALSSVAELPVQVALASVAWGVFCVLLPQVVARRGIAFSAAPLAVAPILLSALTWVEQAVGVAGPQPFIISGVIAGSVVCIAGVSALASARGVHFSGPRPVWIRFAVWLPLLLAVIALFLPAINASVDVNSPGAAFFKGSWTMLGVESLGAWCAVALALLFAGVALTGRQRLVPLVGAVACMAWFVLLDVPTHVLNSWLSPEVQSYYGTEYGRISFASITNVPMMVAVAASALGFLALFLSTLLRRNSAGPESAR